MGDYIESLLIDKDNLDEECVTTPAMYDHFSHQYREAKAELDALGDQMDVVRSKAELEVRSATLEQVNARYNLDLASITEATVKNLVNVDPRVERLRRDIAVKRREVGVFEIAKNSFDKKMFSLNILARLYSSGYFSKTDMRSTGAVRKSTELRRGLREEYGDD